MQVIGVRMIPAVLIAALVVSVDAVSFAQSSAATTTPDCDKRLRFEADPVGDGALLGASAGFAAMSALILSTGEIRPQQIDANFDVHKLLPIDRHAVFQTVDTSAAAFSNAGVFTALGFAALDPVLSLVHDAPETALVDGIMYAEAISFTLALTNMAKIGFRRPRPIAYIDRIDAIRAGQDPATYNNPSTDSSLSFFSSHTALTATVSATATYLAFARAPGTPRPWLTLAGGLVLTSFVGVERVRSGEHFPTDVIAGSLVGAGVGLLAVHLHRENKRSVWVGAAPTRGGGTLALSGVF